MGLVLAAATVGLGVVLVRKANRRSRMKKMARSQQAVRTHLNPVSIQYSKQTAANGTAAYERNSASATLRREVTCFSLGRLLPGTHQGCYGRQGLEGPREALLRCVNLSDRRFGCALRTGAAEAGFCTTLAA